MYFVAIVCLTLNEIIIIRLYIDIINKSSSTSVVLSLFNRIVKEPAVMEEYLKNYGMNLNNEYNLVKMLWVV